MKTLTVLIALATSLSSVSNSDCPGNLPRNENLRQFGTSCYQFYLTQKQHRALASLDCYMKRGHLVDIHSQSEQDFIIKSWQDLRHQAPYETSLWIGLMTTGKWSWSSDNRGLNYQNWAPYQPNEVYEKCCVVEYSGSGEIGKWNDHDCGNYFGWICEYTITNKSTT